jgi:ferrochelatase
MGMNKRVVVILLNMGAPQKSEEIPGYLQNIFSDPSIFNLPMSGFLRKSFVRWIVNKRLPKTRRIYERIGGGSPLNRITGQQAQLLETYLKQKMHSDFQVFYAMRYTEPQLKDVWQAVVAQQYDQAIMLTLYPQYSTTTTGSFIAEWQACRTKDNEALFIKSYYDHPVFIRASADHIHAYMKSNSHPGEQSVLVFSAHGIPLNRAKRGDPYPKEIKACIDAIRARLPQRIETYLGFQSKVGPVRWLKPETSEVIKILAKQGVKKLFVYPVSFVADNSESLYEIDILFREKARSWGIDIFHTIPCLNTDGAFIAALGEITKEIIENKLSKKYMNR